MVDLSNFCGSNFLNYSKAWDAEIPEYSPCFQNTVLVWVPVLVFLLFLPLEIFRLKKKRYFVVAWNPLNVVKVLIVTALIILNAARLVNVVQRRVNGEPVSADMIAGPAILSVTLILVLSLMLVHKKRGILYSPLLTWFWLFSFFAEAVKFYSVISELLFKQMIEPDLTWTIIILATFPLTSISFLLMFLPDKRNIRCQRAQNSNNVSYRLASSSYISQLTFTWILPLIYKGYKHHLTRSDVWTLKSSQRVESSYEKFLVQWTKVQQAFKSCSRSVREKKKHASIVWALGRSFWPDYIYSSLLYLISDLLKFLSPILLNLFLTFIQTDEPLWHGVLLSFCLFASLYVAESMFSHVQDLISSLSVKVQGSLSKAVFRKGLVLSNSARQDYSLGEMANLLSVDIQKFDLFLFFLPTLWTAPVILAIGMRLLWNILGPSCLAGLGILFLCIPYNYFILNYAALLQRKVMTFSDERLKIINEALTGIRVLKLYAWEIPFLQNISELRIKETNRLRKYIYLFVGYEVSWEVISFCMSFASFVTFALLGNVLTPNVAFVSLSLFNIIKVPLMLFPTAISSTIQISVSIKRLNKFLNAEELNCELKVQETGDFNAATSIEHGFFSWGSADQLPILKDISLSLEQGKLTAVVGKVGSGKSSIISALLGEMMKTQGIVKRSGTVAYVPQQAWIQNCTVQKNILFSSPFDREKYKNVVRSCALIEDFKAMIAGDNTEIGEKGINISGGQKQRVSLARAVYHDADIYLLDDPLSAVDAHVGKHLFDKVIGSKGMLNQKTRLLTTNNLTFLPQCDKIIFVNEGQVIAMGTYDTLMQSSEKFAYLVQNYSSNAQEEEEDNDRQSVDLSDDEISENESLLSSSKTKSSVSGGLDQGSFKQMSCKERGELIEEEGMETGKVKFSVYWAYTKQIGKKLSVFILLCYMIFASMQVVCNYWLSFWTRDSLSPNYTGELVPYRIGIYALLAFLFGFMLFVTLMTFAYGHVCACANIHRSMLQSIFQAPLSFFDTTPVGRMMNRFSIDMNNLDYKLQNHIRMFLLFFFNLICEFIAIIIQTPFVAFVFLPLLVFYCLVQRGYLQTSRQLKRIESVTKSPVYSMFSESVSGASSIRAYDCMDRFMKEFEAKLNDHLAAYYLGQLTTRWMEETALFVGSQVILFSALFATFYRDALGPDAAGLSLTYAFLIVYQLNYTLILSSQVETDIVSAERILEYAKVTPEAPYQIPDRKPHPNWPNNGKIVFDNYQTKYRPELDLVLRDISFVIDAGEKIGVCGRTGAGKSSVTLALFRIIEPFSGRIVLDNTDISTIGLHDLRSKLTIIPQDPILFTGSLRFNLDPLKKHSDDDIWNALDLSHLKDFISSVDGGLDFKISEGGGNMSVGQRQLICLTRALLRNTKVLILDEATAAIDLETDHFIQETIRKEFSDCTIITIAHRLNTIVDSSRIIVLENGRIKEFDSPTALLDDKNSIFYAMMQDTALKNK